MDAKRIGTMVLRLEDWPVFYATILMVSAPEEISFVGDSMVTAALDRKRRKA